LRISREIAALVLVALAAGTQLPENNWNASAHYALVQSLGDGSASIDRHLNQSEDIAYRDGHYYAAKSPGLAVISLPLYEAYRAAGAVPAEAPTSSGPPGAHLTTDRAIWMVNLVSIAAFLVLLLLVRSIANAYFPGTGTVVALMLGLGSMLLPFSTQFFSHVLSATLAFAAFALLSKWRTRLLGAAAAGLLAGLAVFTEMPLLVVGLGLGVYAIAARPRLRSALGYGAGFLVGLVPLALFNAWAFGSPLDSGYSYTVKTLGASGHALVGANGQGFYGFSYPRPLVALVLLFSQHGLFVLTPLALVAVLALPRLARHGFRREALLIGGLGIALLLYNSAYFTPFGGHSPGPRLLIPLLPFLSLPLAAALRAGPRIRRVTIAAAAFSAFWMIAATLAQPLVDPTALPTVWIGRVLSASDLSSSVFGGGVTAELAFLVPALAAIALVTIRPRFSLRRSSEPAFYREQLVEVFDE
jgi:hypothetical protein